MASQGETHTALCTATSCRRQIADAIFVRSNTWKGTPWGKYDDAVARRGKQMLAQVPAKEDAEDASMESYDAKHPDVVKVNFPPEMEMGVDV
jgi:hypothetical protein